MNRHSIPLALALATALIAGPLAAQELPFRVTDILTGSNLPQVILQSSAPVAGRYDELSATDKAAVASDYESLAEGDEPPYPRYGVRHLLNPVIRFADLQGPSGPMLATVMVDSQGKPGKITIYRSPDAVMTKLVASQLAIEQYKPAVCHGQPCAMPFVLRLDFAPHDGEPRSAIYAKGFNAYGGMWEGK
jgi:hypothetical protein